MRLLHLVYIHGFQGNDTTFQVPSSADCEDKMKLFPADLQRFLSTNISEHLGLDIQSSLYPTYKSIKPLSFATKNFLEWLSTQPAGPVILLGHSMGGLLAAEAANHASNNYGVKPSRIVGVIAFDTPFLGMHPHVVVTGLASLLTENAREKKENPNLNKVRIVDRNVTDDWEAFKNSLGPSSRPAYISSASNSRSPSPHLSSPFFSINETMSSFLSSHSEDPLFRWARKHADEPFSASKRWIVERFQFGSSMFDPNGLKERYSRLVEWQGLWVNYWTETFPSLMSRTDPIIEQEFVAKTDDTIQRFNSPFSITLSNDPPLPSPLVHSTTPRTAKQSTSQAAQKLANDKRKANPGRHFVVLPNGLGEVLGGWENWEKVLIGGVKDEVAAHCGLFIRGQNLDYDGLVERVGLKVLGWCETI